MTYTVEQAKEMVEQVGDMDNERLHKALVRFAMSIDVEAQPFHKALVIEAAFRLIEKAE